MSAPATLTDTCFENIISLKGACSDIASTSGLYSDDVDITVDFLNEIVTRQFSGVTEFFEKKKAFSIQSVVNQVLTYLRKDFKGNTLLENYRIGQPQDNLNLIAGDGNLKGINIDLCNSDSVLNLFISEISLQVNLTGDVNVLVFDLITGKLIDTVTIPCTADEICTVYPAKEFLSNKKKLNILFAYDSTGINSNTTYLKNNGCVDCTGISINNPYGKISAVKIADTGAKIKSNLKAIGETGGMSIVHSVSCNHYYWLCSYSNILAMPILYKYAESVMQFARDVSPNDRLNTTTNINAEEIERRRVFYDEKYKESIVNVLENIKLPSDKRCFECKEGIRHAISI
jgi:hypothetical protein